MCKNRQKLYDTFMLEKIGISFVTFLRWSERHTKTDMVYLAKGGFWLTLSNIASSVFSLILAMAFSRLISQSDYGTYQYIISTVGILSIPTLVGINTAIVQSVAKGNDQTLISGLKVKIKWGLLGSLASLVAAAYYFYKGNSVLGYGFGLSAFFIPLWENIGIYIHYLQGKKLFRQISVYEMISHGFSVTALIVCLLFISKDPVILVMTFFASWSIARLFFYKHTLKHFPPNNSDDPGMKVYGKHLTIMSVIGTLGSNVDKIMLWHFLGPIQVAIYTFSLVIPLRIVNFAKVINRIAFPKLVQNTNKEANRALLMKIFKLLLILIFVAVVIVFLIPYMFNILFPQYTDSIPYAQVAISLIIFQPITLISSYLTAHTKTKELYSYNTFSPIVKIILYVWLIPIFGIWGALWSMIASKFVDSAVLIYFFLRASHQPQR